MRNPLLVALASGLLACGTGRDAATAAPGMPLPGLDPAALARFRAGQGLFDRVFTPDEGLGPAFNENQCSACHTVPASGGASGFERVVKATRYTGPGRCDDLGSQGGTNVRTRVTPLLAARGGRAETIPGRATETGHFAPPFLFGLGLVEAIPDDQILARADPDDADGDGISGRAGRTPDGRLARFGRKAEFATIRDFIASALFLEMGLTTPSDSVDAINGRRPPEGVDPARDPEIDRAEIDLLTAFVQGLAAPAPAAPRSAAQHDTVVAGERLFERLRCVACHTPTLRTGPADDAALDRRPVPLYSDLLLHDMGSALTDVCGYGASPSELRTQPLMGLSTRDRLLHDGRTDDVREAILAHGGEAQAARDGFARLPWLQQEYVVIFLRSR